MIFAIIMSNKYDTEDWKWLFADTDSLFYVSSVGLYSYKDDKKHLTMVITAKIASTFYLKKKKE